MMQLRLRMRAREIKSLCVSKPETRYGQTVTE